MYSSPNYAPSPQHHSQRQSYSSGYANSGSRHGSRHGGGYPSQYAPQGPPPGADPQLWQWFSAVDTDRSGAISVTELQSALLNGNWTNFDLDTVKMLMAIFDTDRSGSIGFSEFAGLWKYIQDWQNVFRHFDRDHSGSIEGHELAEALRSFGYNLSPNLLTLVEHKYGKFALMSQIPFLPYKSGYSIGTCNGVWSSAGDYFRPLRESVCRS
ncbi:hypothetical protein HGRIS_013506 [Hohenbuehelia grisea]|uniref:EF-hand domain-containing protein n=1 Tax=Hohenbuehelia grisea TaxID=104357 RepID=A0ABR3IVQ9_9AGAR